MTCPSTRLPSTPPKVSIVVPAYNEGPNVRALHSELIKILPASNGSYEIIFSDDGSADSTWQEIENLHNEDKYVKGVRLSRNFGHQHALLAGLFQATGDAVITMDCDLQHPPAVIPRLIDEWHKGSKIVHTVRLDAKNISLFKKFTSKMFYKIWTFLSGVAIENGMADFRLLDRDVVDRILLFREGSPFFRGIVQWVGYPSSRVAFQCGERFSGTTKYTLKKMLSFSLGGITAFSIVPLRIGILLGIVTSVIAFAEIVYAVYSKVFTESTVPGWASAVSILSFLFGILFILLGLFGEYIGRILVEVRRRPRFLISEQIGIDGIAKQDAVCFF